ncbi:hypothetical protein ADK52_25505 [Streptomyces sp. WM6372]|uniref:hypothetical protein n=1 Tax=Streptomyces sp. WM6372 TaxID=1415555 RepID=UPI0006AD9DA0|nr:hypothetical protein [Streptomyces sp. WM6372]KOU20947.1 hypothetical protein ADK52_25505 [Streptomyces sp. WM6372]
MSPPEWIKKLDVFAVVEKLLTLAALILVAITVGGQLGHMLGLHGTLATVAAWSIALVYDALWIGALRMSEVAIRQRSRIGMAVMLGLTVAAIGVSTATLLVLGHAQIFAGVPAAAAVFMGLRIFSSNVLADSATADRIADQSAAARNAHALAAADARQLRSEARTEVLDETAGHLAELHRQTARAEVLTAAQKKISKARAKAEKTLAEADKKHGEKALAFMSRELLTVGPRPVATDSGRTLSEQGGHTVATLVIPEIEAVAISPATADESDSEVEVEQVLVEDAMTLEELAVAAGVDVPEPGVTLTDEQLEVVVRWLRYAMKPPRSYRQAYAAFREAGFQARENRVRRTWGEIETREAEAVPA